jgi:hypothetical protein
MKEAFITKECLYCYGGIFDKHTFKKIPNNISIPLVGRIGEGFVTLFEGKPIRFCFKN